MIYFMPVRSLSLIIATLATLAAAPHPKLEARMDAVIKKQKALAPAFVGMRVISLRDGKVLYKKNEEHLFVPASNMKLFTTALALMRLGPGYRFKTSIVASLPVDAKGRLTGDLILKGGGDPSMSGRAYPYQNQKDQVQNGPPANLVNFSFRPIEDLADQIAAGGLKQVDGDIVGDDSRYLWAPYPEGWSVGDPLWEYGAPVSALILNDNSFALTIRPAESPGDLAQISLTPPFEYFTIDNRIRTVENGDRKIEIIRRQVSRELHLWGAIPLKDRGRTEELAIADPALFAAEVLRDALLERGVAIRGRARARHRFYNQVRDPEQGDPSTGSAPPSAPAPELELARRLSPPLSQLLQVVDKVSQNLHAEVMLREVGAIRENMGSREAGLADMRLFLSEIGVSKDDYRVSDGSGLSRSTLVTPTAITQLLTFMYESEYRGLWIGLLPVGGVDGSLGKRFEEHPEAQRIHAKTGSLGHVRALSGYAESRKYGPVAFSFLVNNFDASTQEITRFLDAAGLLLLK